MSHYIHYFLFIKIIRQDISFFDKIENFTCTLVGGRLLQDVNVICSNYSCKILNAEQDVTIAIGGVIIALITMWQVVIPVTVILTILLFVYYHGNKCVNEMWEAHNTHATQSISKAEEVLTCFRTVKSFHKENYESEKFCQILNSVENVVDRISFVKGIKDAAIEGLSSIMTAVFVYYSSYLIVKKRELGYKSEDFLLMVFAILFAANEIIYYLSIIDDLKKASVSAKKVLAILEKEPRVDQVKEGQTVKDKKALNPKVRKRTTKPAFTFHSLPRPL